MPDWQLAEFIAEADERAEKIRRGLEALRAALGEGRARRELLAGIFREVHTLKGSAAAHGLEALSALAHEFESLLDSVRRGHAPLLAALDLFEEATEVMAAQLLSARRGEEVIAPRSLVERLSAAAQAPDRAPSVSDIWPGTEAALPFEVERALGSAERARLREAVAEGSRLFIVEVEFDAADFDERFRELSAALSETGEMLATVPGIREGAPSRVVFHVVYATHEADETLLARVATFGASLQSIGEETGAHGSQAWGVTGGPADSAQSETNEAAESVALVSVRVPLEELDELVAAAHDLFRETVAALEASGAAPAQGRASDAGPVERVRRRFSEFEQRLIGLRLIPLEPVMEIAAWAGRAAARAAGREVAFELRGGDVRVDRALAEAVAGPLLHLARNAAAHGVEPAESRIRQGKPARGRVCIEAVAVGARVNLRVSDDGRGIDAARVGRVAVARGLVRPGAPLGEEAALRLIFAPGFSTIDEVTGAAGRGVGLEVVERAVERAGGEVRVWTETGRGATFELSLPARLALVPALVVRSGPDLYCLDTRGVVAVDSAGTVPAKALPERAILEWRGETLPILALSRLLGQVELREQGSADAGTQPFVVVRVAGRDGAARAAVAFDELRGREEVLSRGLGRHAARWRGVSGATELREGGVALVLDLPRLIAASG